MSLEQLDMVLETYRTMVGDLPTEESVEKALAKSMTAGVSVSVQYIVGLETWKTSVPFLREAISDIPNDVENNREIAARVFGMVEGFFPSFISGVGENKEKTAHVAGVMTRLIQEIRNVSS